MGLPRIDRSRMFGGNKKRRSHYWRGGQSRCHFQSADPGQSRRPRGPLASGRSEAVIYTVDVGRSRHPHLLHTLFQSRWLSPAAITDGSSRAYWNHWCGGANYGFCRHIATLSHCHIVTLSRSDTFHVRRESWGSTRLGFSGSGVFLFGRICFHHIPISVQIIISGISKRSA